MTVTERLLASSRELWDAYNGHPFVRGIADGSLDEEKFRYYMIQDYLYLIDYAKVFALGVVKAVDMESMRLFANYVHQILDGEMEIHKAYMKRLGITCPREDEWKAHGHKPSGCTGQYSSACDSCAFRTLEH